MLDGDHRPLHLPGLHQVAGRHRLGSPLQREGATERHHRHEQRQLLVLAAFLAEFGVGGGGV